MTRMTSVAKSRKFEMIKGPVMPLIVRRENTLPTPEVKIVDCIACKKPIRMQYKQLVFWHGECRTEGRRLLKLQLKRKALQNK